MQLLAWEAVLALLYAVIWLGRWVGWYVEVRQLRTLLGLAPGPSPLNWRETLPYLPFALLLCDVLPLLLRAFDAPDVPVLCGLILPYLLLPAAGFPPGCPWANGRACAPCTLWPALCVICPWCSCCSITRPCSTALWYPSPPWRATCWAGCTAGRRPGNSRRPRRRRGLFVRE